MQLVKLIKFLANASGVPGAISWAGTLKADGLTGDRNWDFPDASGTLWTNNQTVTIPWVQQFEIAADGTVPGVIPWKNIPVRAVYAKGWLIGAGGGSGSGARGAVSGNRTGGSSGSGGSRTPFFLYLPAIAAKLNCSILDLQYRETIGLAGAPGAAVTTDNTDGVSGTVGGTTTLVFRVDPATGNPAPQIILCRAGGGSPGQGGRRGAVATTGGAVVQGGTYPGQVGQAGRFIAGNSAPPHIGGPSAGGGGGGAAAGVTSGSPGGTSGPACSDQFGDISGITLTLPYPAPGNAAQILVPGLAGSGGAGGGHPPSLPGGAGGAGFRGSSGGGGGASDNGFNSGAGGPSGNGYSLIIFSPYPL